MGPACCGNGNRQALREGLRELGLEKFAQLGRRLKLGNRVQFLECRRERVRETLARIMRIRFHAL
jgi:hypothetical protein